MIKRLFDGQPIREAVTGCDYDFDADLWVYDFFNVALTNEDGDISLFQFERPGVYNGHWFFNNRGKKAFEVANEMLKELFDNHPVEVIVGITPLDKPGARSMARRVGFTSHGLMETPQGPCELFIMTKGDKWVS